jgi:hypothetical protein
MQKGSVASITQFCSRHGVPTGHRLTAVPLAVALLGLTSWLGCEGAVEPVLGPAVEVQVTPTGMSISGAGATATFSVVALNASGDTVTSPVVTWSSLNPHIATVNEHGTATAVASGQVTIVAEVDELVAHALLTVSTPEVGPVTSWVVEVPPVDHLSGVWGTSSTDVFAVGDYGTILHYDGTEWSPMTSGIDKYLGGVWGTSSSDVYAVEHLWDGANWNGTILHYDGSSWSAMTGEMTWRPISAVWGTSSSDLYAVGGGGTILHYDGTDWSPMTSGTDKYLMGVWGTSSTYVYAVGGDGTILHYDGASWSVTTSGTSVSLFAVWGTSSGEVYAVGDYGMILRGTR